MIGWIKSKEWHKALLTFLGITVLAVLCYLGMRLMMEKSGYLPSRLTPGTLMGQAAGRYTEQITYLDGPIASLQPEDGGKIQYYFFLPKDNPDGKIAVVGVRESLGSQDLEKVLAQSYSGDASSQGQPSASVQITGTVYPLPPDLRAYAKEWMGKLAGTEVTDEELGQVLYPYCLEEDRLTYLIDPYVLFYSLFGILYLVFFAYVAVSCRKNAEDNKSNAEMPQTDGTFSNGDSSKE